jgi:tetratricopeptide (TPR) repeat protein
MHRAVLVILFIAAPTLAQTPELAEAARLSSQVVQFYQAGRYQDALPLAKQALALREKALGAEHPVVGEALQNLASLYLRLDDAKQAAPLAERALALHEKARPLNEDAIAATLVLLAGVRYADNNFDDAIPLFQRALNIRERISGASHPLTLDLVLALANAHYRNLQFGSAQFLYRSFADAQTRAGGTSDDAAFALERLSCLLWRQGEEDEAKTTEARADALRGYAGPYRKLKGKDLRLNQLPQTLPDAMLDKKYVDELRGFMGGVGEVEVRVLINEQGETLRACALYGPPFLFTYYENAALRARFKPFDDKGRPAKVTGNLKYIYEFARVRPRRD